jgi:hypothetical protein
MSHDCVCDGILTAIGSHNRTLLPWHNRGGSTQRRGGVFVRQSPNLGITIFLYVAGILLVMMAVVLLLQSFGVLTTIPRSAIWALVLLAIGSGILAGIRRRA